MAGRPKICFWKGAIYTIFLTLSLALIMHKLNHESIVYTKRYLGITDDELQAVVERLNL
jgi:hypothetical protein